MKTPKESFPTGYHVRWPWWSAKNSPLPLTTKRKTRAEENRQAVIHIMLGTAPEGTTKALLYVECGPSNPEARGFFRDIAFARDVPPPAETKTP